MENYRSADNGPRKQAQVKTSYGRYKYDQVPKYHISNFLARDGKGASK